MKILHICTGFKLSHQGGITNYVRSLAESQHINGHEVTVMGDHDTIKFPYKYFEYASSKINSFVCGPLRDKRALDKIKEFLDQENFDIIHIHMPLNIDWDLYKILKSYNYLVSLHDYYYICPRIIMTPKEGIVCDKYDMKKCKHCISFLQRFKMARFLSKKMALCTSKESYMPYIPQEITKKRYEKFKELLEKAEYVLPVSNRVREIYQNSKINANYKVLHIGNITADNYNPKYEVKAVSGKIRLVFLGRLSYYKGVNLLFYIADHVDREKYDIIFYGYAGEYEGELKKRGIVNKGKYQQSELSSILEKMDIGLVLSTWEDNAPQVVMEMLNNHLPVVGTRMGGIPDFVNEENGFLFNPYDEEEVDKVIEFFEKLDRKKIQLLKSNIKRTLTTKEHYDELMRIYSNVLDREKRRN